MKIIPVILSGGSGTRLWPLSRKQHPKQYLSLSCNKTLLQETILRLEGLDNLVAPLVICNDDHRFLVLEQLKSIGVNNPMIILEPIGKNTAPAILAAALHVIKSNMGSKFLMLVLSADHVIQDKLAFHRAIDIATKQAIEGKLVTFGVVPVEANTGYGYIKVDSRVEHQGAFSVECFVEKPDKKTASQYIEQGDYLWNSGMFMFQPEQLVSELSLYAKDMVVVVKESVKNTKNDLGFICLEKEAFQKSPCESIDNALMEKSQNVVVVPLDAKWNDIGSWSALYDISNKDKDGNVIKGDVITKDTINTYINADHHMVATIGVSDLIIVDTPDATLVASKDKAQEVKTIVEKLKGINRDEYGVHRKVYRPWGWFDSIQTGDNFQVKKLYVNPGAKLSLQMHYKRAEHWVVVRGIANVVNGDGILVLEKGQSTFIPQGVKHSLENRGELPLEVIEVQSGSYLGEDDIVRFEDVYGRD